MEKILYLTDLDGTLLNSHTLLTKRTKEMINTLVCEGMQFSYATARSFQSASKVTQGLSLNLPVICYNGAFLVDPQSGKRLFSCVFSDSEREELRRFVEMVSCSPFVYSLVNGKEQVRFCPELLGDGGHYYLSNRIGDPRMCPVQKIENLFDGQLFYLTWIGEREELLPVARQLEKDNRFRCIFQQELYREEYWLEIMPRLATKAEAAERLKEWCGCKRLICFGDRINDIPMFLVSDEAYAVQEAAEELKAVATGVLGSNEKDAVAEFLWKKGFGNQ